MELKKILNQNLQKASKTPSHFCKQSDYLKSEKSEHTQSLILSDVICKITKPKYNCMSHFKARYEEMLCALMKTPNSGYHPVKSDTIEKNTHQKKI